MVLEAADVFVFYLLMAIVIGILFAVVISIKKITQISLKIESIVESISKLEKKEVEWDEKIVELIKKAKEL